MRTFINSHNVWFRRFDRKNGWPSYAKNQQEAALPYCGSIGRFEAKHSYIFLQHLNTSDLHEGDCSANSFHQSSLGEQWCLPGLPAKTTCSHVLIIAIYRLLLCVCVCVWMVLDGFCVLDFDDLLPLKYDWPRRSQGFCRQHSFNAARIL